MRKIGKKAATKPKEEVFDEKKLREEIARSARALGLSKSTGDKIAEAIVEKVAAKMKKRAVATSDDLNRFIAAEAEKFNKDLAYVYKNRGKII